MSSAPVPPDRRRRRTIGLVLAACGACCAGPVLAALVGVGTLASVLAFLTWPALGVAVAAVTVTLSVTRVRRRSPIDPSTH